ncbi:hypothetical protein B0H13DRAFT_406385 [Mycena leptocephala]|nr:hypothetical protein B0H13DRAFT_406385 [Mycena leptocephala]
MDPAMSTPVVGPADHTLEMFWKRVAEVTMRYHDAQQRWIGGEEVKRWNDANRKPCERCANSKSKKACIVDTDHPSCRPCRDNKVACDRKPRFVFDMTKDRFFPSYNQFLRVFQDRKPKQISRLRRHEYKFRNCMGAHNMPSELEAIKDVLARQTGALEVLNADLDIAQRKLSTAISLLEEDKSDFYEMQCRIFARAAVDLHVRESLSGAKEELEWVIATLDLSRMEPESGRVLNAVLNRLKYATLTLGGVTDDVIRRTT